MPDYRILRTAPSTYSGRNGRPVTGFQVEIFLPEFDEEHTLNVPNLETETVKQEAETLLANRRKLVDLGG